MGSPRLGLGLASPYPNPITLTQSPYNPNPNPNQVRYVGLTTTVFASRSAYKYAKEKRADAVRAD